MKLQCGAIIIIKNDFVQVFKCLYLLLALLAPYTNAIGRYFCESCFFSVKIISLKILIEIKLSLKEVSCKTF